MGRRKIRNYPPKESYEILFKNYFEQNKEDVIDSLLNELGYDSLERLREDERNMKFGFDCGWTIIYPKNREMEREWKLDNGMYDYQIFAHPSYYPQSTTVQEIQVRKALKDLNLEDEFGCYVKLD